MKLNKKQEIAIECFNKALLLLKKANIQICGMDDSIIYATNDAIKELKSNNPNIGNDYNHVADSYKVLQYNNDNRAGSFKTSGVYVDSGGW